MKLNVLNFAQSFLGFFLNIDAQAKDTGQFQNNLKNTWNSLIESSWQQKLILLTDKWPMSASDILKGEEV